MTVTGPGSINSAVFGLPDRSATYVMPLERPASAKTTHDGKLDNGVFKSITTDRPSSALALVSAPLDIAKAALTAVSEVVQLRILIVNTSGYPADKRIGTQWFNSGRIAEIGPRVVECGLDTDEGQSGSPIFMRNENSERVVVAVHAYGGDSVNRGIRITDDVFDLFTSWLA